MALTITDPGHVALRKGIRAAIALPIAMAIALYAVDDVSGLLFTIFGTIGLLVNGDFAGSALQRTGSYLLTGIAGSAALVVGWAASFSTAAAVVVTVVVVFALAFANLLRGPVALGTPAVLLVFVVAVSIDGTSTSLPDYLLGWWLAVAVSIIAALVLFPHNRTADHRAALAAALTEAARSAERAWLPNGREAAAPVVENGVDPLAAINGGAPFRTDGLTARDQAMTLLVDHVTGIRVLVEDPDEGPLGPSSTALPARDDLVHAIVAALDDVALAMTDPRHLPTGAGVDEARVHLTYALENWVLAESSGGTDAGTVSQRIAADHRLRMASLVVEQMVELARIANGGEVESLERMPPIQVRSRGSIVVSQLHPRSPWLRNSLRSALALGAAVLVVNLAGVERGFWVLIGVISILRFDAVGTRRFALQAVVGAIVGVGVATVILVLLGDQQWMLWVLLPPTVFLATWSSAAISYPVGQAAFSALIIVALAIVVWPPELATGLVRIEDIALGAAVALVIGLVMWPRGAVGYLRDELADAIRAAGAYLSAALGSFTEPVPAGQLAQQRQQALGAAERASETYAVALLQHGPAEDLRPWTRAAVTAFLLIYAARVVERFATATPTLTSHPELTEAIAAAQRSSTARWTALAAATAAEQSTTLTEPEPALPLPVLDPVASREDARDLIIAVWVTDWVRHLHRLSTGSPPAAPVLA